MAHVHEDHEPKLRDASGKLRSTAPKETTEAQRPGEMAGGKVHQRLLSRV